MIKVSKASLGEEELQSVKEVFDVGWLGMGNHVLQFEDALKQFFGAEHVIAVNTGTSALHLAAHALGIGPGDEVIIPSITYVASFQAVSATGATPVACDVLPDSLLVDLQDAERKITPRTKAIMPVHYCGNPCDMDAIFALAQKSGLRVIEDAAHAFGSSYNGKKIGSFGDAVCFSFDSIKNITCGEGGAIICFDAALAEKCRNARLLGVDRESSFRYRNERQWFYSVKSQGFRYHMSNINAAIGLAQLKKLPAFLRRKRQICRRYNEAFDGIDGLRLIPMNVDEAAPFIYTVRVGKNARADFMTYLREREVETGIYYLPNHWHAMYEQPRESLPVSNRAGDEIVSLPLHCNMTDADAEKVIAAVQDFFKCNLRV
jgi:perosamine synthetase